MKGQKRNKSTSGIRRSRILVASVVVTLGAFGTAMLGGCPSVGEPSANQVFMRAIAFDPEEITITAGESVTWINKDLVIPHTATSGNPGDADLGSVFKSALLSTDQSFTHTFETAGEFVYYCEVHPVMMRDAKVIVLPAE